MVWKLVRIARTTNVGFLGPYSIQQRAEKRQDDLLVRAGADVRQGSGAVPREHCGGHVQALAGDCEQQAQNFDAVALKLLGRSNCLVAADPALPYCIGDLGLAVLLF